MTEPAWRDTPISRWAHVKAHDAALQALPIGVTFGGPNHTGREYDKHTRAIAAATTAGDFVMKLAGELVKQNDRDQRARLADYAMTALQLAGVPLAEALKACGFSQVECGEALGHHSDAIDGKEPAEQRIMTLKRWHESLADRFARGDLKDIKLGTGSFGNSTSHHLFAPDSDSGYNQTAGHYASLLKYAKTVGELAGGVKSIIDENNTPKTTHAMEQAFVYQCMDQGIEGENAKQYLGTISPDDAKSAIQRLRLRQEYLGQKEGNVSFQKLETDIPLARALGEEEVMRRLRKTVTTAAREAEDAAKAAMAKSAQLNRLVGLLGKEANPAPGNVTAKDVVGGEREARLGQG